MYLFGYSDVNNNYVLVMSVLYENILFLKKSLSFLYEPSTEGNEYIYVPYHQQWMIKHVLKCNYSCLIGAKFNLLLNVAKYIFAHLNTPVAESKVLFVTSCTN